MNLKSSVNRNETRCQALIALLLVFLPNLVLTGVGLLMRGQAQQVTEAQAAGHFGLARFLRQVGLNAFLLLPMGAWLWRRQDGWRACGWQRERLWRAAGLGVLLGAATFQLSGPIRLRKASWTRHWRYLEQAPR